MAGRGGRGAELLQALKCPIRKPQNIGQRPPSQIAQGQPAQQFQGQPSQYQGQPSQYQGQPSQYQGQPSQYQGQHVQGQPPQFKSQLPQFQGQAQQVQGQAQQVQGAPEQFQGQPRQFSAGPQSHQQQYGQPQSYRPQQPSQFRSPGMHRPPGQVPPQGVQQMRQVPPQMQYPHGQFPTQSQLPPRGQYRPQTQQTHFPTGQQFQRGQFSPQGQASQRGQYPPQGQPPRPRQFPPSQQAPRGGQYPPPRQQPPPRGPFPVRGQGPSQQPSQSPSGQGSTMQQGRPTMGRGGMPPMQQQQPYGGGRPMQPSTGPGQVSNVRPQMGLSESQPQTFGRGSFPQQQTQPSGVNRYPPFQQQQPSPPPPEQTAPVPPSQALQQMSLEEKPIPPKTQTGEKGTAGKPVPLAVNYIPIRCKVEHVYQYCVSYSPEIDSRNMRYRLLFDHSNVLGETRAFDGIILYLPFKLQDQPTTFKSVRPTDGAEITLTLQMVKLQRLDECPQIYNIIFRKVMRTLQMQQVGRYYYDPTRPAQIPQHKLELWPGYITSIQRYEGGLMLLADVSHRLLRTETVLEFLLEIYNTNRQNFQEVATKTLVGTVVLTRYNNKTYRIDDIEWEKSPQAQFMFHTGQMISYIDYYKQHYNKELVNHNQPLLVHRPKQRREPNAKGKRPPLEVIMLVPELCTMTGLTDVMRKDFRVMKDLAVHTRLTPMQREECMKKFMANVNSNPEAKKHLAVWGMELDHGLLRTDGRLLPPEKIKFGGSAIMCNPQADWGREAVKEAVITPIGLSSWIVVFTKRDQSKAMDFIQTMKKVTPAMGITVADPVVLEARDDRTETYLRTIREHLNPTIQLVVIIFPTSRDDRYAAVKKLCCVEYPVPSQVINGRTISQQNKLRSVTQKIALQINCKLGGELWALDVPLKSLMVIGIDVYHDASRGGRSVGGFVASTNRSLTRWYSRVCFQTPGQELVDGLKMCLTSALKRFHEINHTLPEKVVVYRDGVGDGQLNTVCSYEVPQLSECFALFGETYQPQLAVIIVQKRVNTRIFSYEARNGQHMLDNPGPGTVLDHTITRKDWYDFFLVSQHVRQGTVTPSHYIVVHNSSSLKPDHVQRLSYKLTHLYYNWPGTVRVPAPCQYAHKLAFLVGTSIHRDPALALSDRLFYL